MWNSACGPEATFIMRLHCEMIKNWIEMKHSLTFYCLLGFFLWLSTVRHDNYSNDWMEIVKSLRINNKSNSIVTNATNISNALNTLLTHVVQFYTQLTLRKMRFLCDNWKFIQSGIFIRSYNSIRLAFHFDWIVISLRAYYKFDANKSSCLLEFVLRTYFEFNDREKCMKSIRIQLFSTSSAKHLTKKQQHANVCALFVG